VIGVGVGHLQARGVAQAMGFRLLFPPALRHE